MDIIQEVMERRKPGVRCAPCKVIINAGTAYLIDTFHKLLQSKEYAKVPERMKADFEERAISGDLALQAIYEPLVLDMSEAIQKANG